MKGVASFSTRYGEARIGGIRYRPDAEKLDSVEVWVGEQAGNPTYRLINPPTLVADPTGDVVLVEKDHVRKTDVVRRYRVDPLHAIAERSEEHTSELQSLMRISYAVFCFKIK